MRNAAVEFAKPDSSNGARTLVLRNQTGNNASGSTELTSSIVENITHNLLFLTLVNGSQNDNVNGLLYAFYKNRNTVAAGS